MKNIILTLLIIGTILVSNNLFAQSGKCERKVVAKSALVVTPRGFNSKIKSDMKEGKRIFMGKTFLKKKANAAPQCMISISNDIEQDVDVYIDGNYMGSIKSSSTGVIESLAGYSEVYCVSADKETCWTETGDCKCTYVFKLAKDSK